MKQSEREWILDLIKQHQKRQDSLLKHFRKDRASAQSWKEDDKDEHMVEWCMERSSFHLRMLRAQQDMITELADLLELRIVKFQDEVLMPDQIIKSRAGVFVKTDRFRADKFRTGHERLMCTRDRI